MQQLINVLVTVPVIALWTVVVGIITIHAERVSNNKSKWENAGY